MTKARKIQHRVPFDIRKVDITQEPGMRELGIVVVPVVLTRAELARVFGKSPTWIDAYLTNEGRPLMKHVRYVNGRKMWLTKAVLEFIEARV